MNIKFNRIKLKSVTIDNGLEFTDIIDICKEKWIEWYRCDPIVHGRNKQMKDIIV